METSLTEDALLGGRIRVDVRVPLLGEAAECAVADFVALARDFGLTAAAAARLPQESTNGEEDDEEAKLLRAFSPEG